VLTRLGFALLIETGDKDGKEAAVPKMQTFRNLKLRLPKDGTASIIWAANDATMYSFEWSKGKEGPKETTSTYDYYLRRYGKMWWSYGVVLQLACAYRNCCGVLNRIPAAAPESAFDWYL
jgi:hypothetical protein